MRVLYGIYGIFGIFLFLLVTAPISGAEVFKYTDEHGTISFTDDVGKVPESQRPPAPATPSGPLGKILSGTVPQRWIDHPISKYIITFIVLAVITLVVQSRTESLLLRLALKLFFIGCIAAAIYGVLVLQQPAFQKAAEPYLPSPAPIEQTQKALKKAEENQKKQEDLINSLLGVDKQQEQK